MGSFSPQPLNAPGMVNLVTSVRSRAVHTGAGSWQVRSASPSCPQAPGRLARTGAPADALSWDPRAAGQAVGQDQGRGEPGITSRRGRLPVQVLQVAYDFGAGCTARASGKLG
jgi:hypothetical protein